MNLNPGNYYQNANYLNTNYRNTNYQNANYLNTNYLNNYYKNQQYGENKAQNQKSEEKNNIMLDNVDYYLKLDTGEELCLVKELLLGKGTYGEVYCIGNRNIRNQNIECVIKIVQNEKMNNEYQNEAHFYKTSSTKNNIFKFLPQFDRIGKAYDLKNNKKISYDYMILEYVGKKNLDLVISKLVFSNNNNVSKYFNILYICLFSHLQLIHESDLSIRDIAFNNIVVNDCILEQYNNGYGFKLDKLIGLFNQKRYGDIVRFIDLGLAGDIKYLIEMKKYDPSNYMFFGNFYNICDGIEGIFVGRNNNLSPFCKFNFSSFINLTENEKTSNNSLLMKAILDNCLVMSDFWSLCIIFTINLYNTTGLISNNYEKDIMGRSNFPFKIINNEIKLREQLNIFFEEKFDKDHTCFEELRKNISSILKDILNYSNKLLQNSYEKNNIYNLNLNNDSIIYLYKQSIQILYQIYGKINDFKQNYITYLKNYE